MWFKNNSSKRKLTDEQIVELKRQRKAGVPVKELSKIFGLHYSTIYQMTENHKPLRGQRSEQ